jgi:hypothetical protein
MFGSEYNNILQLDIILYNNEAIIIIIVLEIFIQIFCMTDAYFSEFLTINN